MSLSLRDPYPAGAAHRRRPAAALEPLESRLLFAATPELLADVNLTSDHLAPRDLVTAGSVAYFGGRNAPADGYELFRTDGTHAGTVMVRDLVPGIAGSDPQSLTVVGNRVYFSAADANGDRELYVSDGTAGG